MLTTEHYYLTGLPIQLNSGLGLVHQPKLRDLFDNNITVEEFAQPFCVRVNAIDLGEDEVIKELLNSLKDFDLFFIDDSEMLKKLKRCLCILYKTANVFIDVVNQELVIDDHIKVNRDNYTYLARFILDMLCLQEPKKPENKRKYQDDYRQKIWEKMQRYRAEKEKKNTITTLDMMNTVIHAFNLRYSEILDYTYYQLTNSYSTYMSKNSYDEFMMYKTSGQFKLEDEVKHWTTMTRIKKGIAL